MHGLIRTPVVIQGVQDENVSRGIAVRCTRASRAKMPIDKLLDEKGKAMIWSRMSSVS